MLIVAGLPVGLTAFLDSKYQSDAQAMKDNFKFFM